MSVYVYDMHAVDGACMDWHDAQTCHACGHAGARPPHLSEKEYSAALLDYYPRTQFAHNVKMHLDAWNIIARHEVNTQARVQLKLTPHLKDLVSNANAF